LADERLSLFVTLVGEVLLEDPDLDTAIFQILDFSRPAAEEKRRLLIVEAREIPRLTDSRKRAMLETFADGYRRARDELAGVKPEKKDRAEEKRPDPNQHNLFGGDAER
jgi:hypothetical protein